MTNAARPDRDLLTSSEGETLSRRLRRVRVQPWTVAALPSVTMARLLVLRWSLWGAGIIVAALSGIPTASEMLQAPKVGLTGVVISYVVTSGLVGAVIALPLVAAFARCLKFAQDREERRVTAQFLHEIGYAQRRAQKDGHEGASVAHPPTPDEQDGADAPNYWATGTYDPDRYGVFVRDSTPEWRRYVHDAYGSLDAYESNKPD